MPLSAEQVAEFHENGVLIAAGILTDEDLEAVIQETAEFIDYRARELHALGRLAEMHANEPFERRYGLLWHQTPEIAVDLDIMERRGPRMFEFLRNPNLLDAVEALLGTPEIICSPIQHIRGKIPRKQQVDTGYSMSGDVPWHQDSGVTWEEADASDIITCWIPLVDATRENGCMAVLPKVWKNGYLEHVKEGGTQIRPDLLPKVEPIIAECPKGGVVFMNKLTPHMGLSNHSQMVRWTIDLRYQRTGTATGRPFHPHFPVRSRANPESVLTDHQTWCNMWIEALDKSRGVQMHRVK